MWTVQDLMDALAGMDKDALIALYGSDLSPHSRVSANELGNVRKGKEVLPKHAPAGTKARNVVVLSGSGFYLGCGVQLLKGGE